MKMYRAEKTPAFRIATLLALLLAPPLAAAPLAAQDAAEDTQAASAAEAAQAGRRRPIEQEIFEVEHADPAKLAQVLTIFPIHVEAHPELGLITLRGTRADLDAALAAARRLDVARARSPSVEVVAHVLRASRSGAGKSAVPPALEDVAKQLRSVFGFGTVSLLDSLVVRASDRASGQVSGHIASGADPIGYRFGFNRLTLLDRPTEGGGREVRLDGLLFETDAAGGDVRLVTDLEVREGQQAVVGKAASGREADDSLIVVLEVKVLD